MRCTGVKLVVNFFGREENGMVFDKIRMGKTLKELRGSRTLSEVAKAVGVTTSSMSMYESGERIPRDQVKMALAKYYGRSVSYIFFDEESH